MGLSKNTTNGFEAVVPTLPPAGQGEARQQSLMLGRTILGQISCESSPFLGRSMSCCAAVAPFLQSLGAVWWQMRRIGGELGKSLNPLISLHA